MFPQAAGRTDESTEVLRVERKHLWVVLLKLQPTLTPTMSPGAVLSNGPLCGAEGGFMQSFFFAQSHSAATVTAHPVILGVLKWEQSPNIMLMSGQFTTAHRLQNLKTIKFLLEAQAPHSYSCPCTRSTPGPEAEAIFRKRWASGERGYSIHMER